LNYLENITAHFQEFGPVAERTAIDLEHELAYHNSWHEYEVEQERKAGIKEAVYREINLYQLRALSKRKLMALAETGQEDEPSFPAAQRLDMLIEQAIAEEETLNRLTTSASDEPPV
jgi:hypothetical protein